MRQLHGWLGAALMVVSVGCDTTGVRRDHGSYQRQRFMGVEFAAAMAAAERAVGEHFAIAERDADAGVVRSEPTEGGAGEAGDPAHVNLGTPSRARRLAEVRVVRDGDEIEVLCRVQLQQLETDPFRSRQYDRGTFDEPTDSPAERDASTTPEQNALWQTRRRDRMMERAILAAVAEQLGRT
ncbi:MAG: hypothetical protein HOP29_15750 [Phycisphaerales bacterium]|nr:hypothetical protein [Phycisphaerales bacterium]